MKKRHSFPLVHIKVMVQSSIYTRIHSFHSLFIFDSQHVIMHCLFTERKRRRKNSPSSRATGIPRTLPNSRLWNSPAPISHANSPRTQRLDDYYSEYFGISPGTRGLCTPMARTTSKNGFVHLPFFKSQKKNTPSFFDDDDAALDGGGAHTAAIGSSGHQTPWPHHRGLGDGLADTRQRRH